MKLYFWQSYDIKNHKLLPPRSIFSSEASEGLKCEMPVSKIIPLMNLYVNKTHNVWETQII